MHLKTRRQVVLFENVGIVEGLAVDPHTENIYWTEVTEGTVVIGHKNRYGVYERLVLVRELHKPRSITLASKLGLMFIVEGSKSVIITMWHMDGSGRKELVQVNGTISGMAFDGKHLYFSDSLFGTIDRIEVDSRNRSTVQSNLGVPIAMDIIANSTFWLTENSTFLSWFNNQPQNRMRDFVIETVNISAQFRLMVSLSPADSMHDHFCMDPSANCSDICVPVPTKAKCLCPLGKSLSKDLLSCRNDTVEASREQLNNRLIPEQAKNKSAANVSYSERLEFKSILEAVLDGPVHVQSRLFTKKGHTVGNDETL